MPVITSGKTMFDMDGMMTATKFTRWLAKAPAILLGTYPNSLAACKTLSRVVADTSPRPRKTRLTVISETPDASDTSRKVSGRCVFFVTWEVLDLFS
jgi:hypothetical protein